MLLAQGSQSDKDQLRTPSQAIRGWLARQRAAYRQISPAYREAGLIGLCIAGTVLAILQFDLGGLIFAAVEHRPDYKRDALILAALTLSAGLAIFALRRWHELIREVKIRIAAEERSKALAGEDELTGLPNRRALLNELTQAMARADRGNGLVSLVLLDLDRFKPVNDVHGHIAGDLLLQAVAQRLRQNARGGECVARLGGDEFAVLVSHDKDDVAAAAAAAKRFSDVLCQPVTLGSIDVQVGVSAGIATAPHDANTVEALMRCADLALYRAKDEGKGGCKLFDVQMDAEVRERADIEADLRWAIDNGGISPHYQPLVDLRSGRIAGFEALARWEHPRQGYISPARFIPIAEESGLINALGLAMLRRACRHALRWGDDMMLAVNISPVQLADTRLAEKMLAILAEEGLPARRLEVELTENTLVSDFGQACGILNTLKSHGVSICIDDFGAGYSSLKHLTAMPFDRAKIDRGFVQALGSDGDRLKVIRAIVGLCTSLGLACTGEGAETAEQVALLRAAGCSLVQGWYFGMALPPDATLALAAEGRVSLTKLHAKSAPAMVSGAVKRSLQSPLA